MFDGNEIGSSIVPSETTVQAVGSKGFGVAKEKKTTLVATRPPPPALHFMQVMSHALEQRLWRPARGARDARCSLEPACSCARTYILVIA